MSLLQRHLAATLICLLTVTLACAPSPAPGAGSANPSAAQPDPPKVLTIALQRELTAFGDFYGGLASAGGGSGVNVGGNSPEVRLIAHDMLVVGNDRYVWVPHLAQEQLSVEKGTWRINPDGTMDTTWRIRPNIKWQDGTPFTSADLLFTFTVYMDPEFPSLFARPIALMQSAETPDPQTITIHWSGVYSHADEAPALNPIPRHLLADLYARDKQAFASSTVFTTDWVGVGPYRLTRWDAGVQMEFTRFDDYYLGRPPLDRVIVRYMADGNAQLAALLAGAVDVVPPASIDVETAVQVAEQMQGTGNRIRLDPTERLEQLEFQQRPEYAKPPNGVTNQQVRQALYYGTDRHALAEVINHNLAPVTDAWFPPGHPLAAEVESAIPKYPYDPARAQQLLTSAGWVRGGDGRLTHQADGTPFQLEILARAGTAGLEKLIQVAAQQWQALGVDATARPIPAALSANREYQATQSGVLAAFPGAGDMYEVRLNSRYIATARNRWTGQNRAGYRNPRVDELMDELIVAIAPREQVRLHRELVQLVFTDVPFIPVTWDVYPVLVGSGVKGDPSAVNSGWNIFEWDKG